MSRIITVPVTRVELMQQVAFRQQSNTSIQSRIIMQLTELILILFNRDQPQLTQLVHHYQLPHRAIIELLATTT